jgi:copper chaperone CopZ
MSTATREISVPAISCDHCKAAIEGSVSTVDGVTAVVVDIEAKTVSVTGGDYDEIVVAIDDAGFDVA